MKKEEYLSRIDEVIARGPSTDTWDSLCEHPTPKWYARDKFGIFIHWGVYSVPAFGNEWYPRNMYVKGSKENLHHTEKYGTLDKYVPDGDYVVIKFARWAFEKFKGVED